MYQDDEHDIGRAVNGDGEPREPDEPFESNQRDDRDDRDEHDEPSEPLIGRGRSGRAPAPADEIGATDPPAPRAIPRPQLEPARRLAAAWTPARGRLGLGIALVAGLAVAWFALAPRPTPVAVPASTPDTAAEPTTVSRPPPTQPPTTSKPVPPWVPRAIASTCHARTTAADAARLVVDCAPGRGVATLRYRELPNATALQTAYEGQRRARHNGTGPSRCASGRNDERAWSSSSTPATAAGRYRCSRPHAAARIEWTDDALDVVATATRTDGDLRSLYVWWTTVPGPVEPARAR